MQRIQKKIVSEQYRDQLNTPLETAMDRTCGKIQRKSHVNGCHKSTIL